MDYLEVPVYARFNAGSSSTSGAIVYGTVGVDLNFLLKSKLSTGEDVMSQFNRADYGLAAGVGVETARLPRRRAVYERYREHRQEQERSGTEDRDVCRDGGCSF